jgi:hypothetical protein
METITDTISGLLAIAGIVVILSWFAYGFCKVINLIIKRR